MSETESLESTTTTTEGSSADGEVMNISYCVCGSENVDVLLDGGTRVCASGHYNSPCSSCEMNVAYGEIEEADTLCASCRRNQSAS